MPDLIAQGPQRRDRWRRRLPERGQPALLGRDTSWKVDWDRCVSRRHAKLSWHNRQLQVDQDPSAANPIYFDGRPQKSFRVRLGQHFVIGDTSFTVVDHAAAISLQMPMPIDQQTFSSAALGNASFQHAHHQIHALSQLPEIVAAAGTDSELYTRLIHLIFDGFAPAKAAAVVRFEEKEQQDASANPQGDTIKILGSDSQAGDLTVLHWDRLDQERRDFQPSGPLIRQAITSGENVIHYWRSPADSNLTLAEDFDWAFCSPIPGFSARGDALYVAGHSDANARDELLQDGLKFVQLVASTVGSVRDIRQLQQQATVLSQFFSAPVREAVSVANPEVALAPRETDVTVMFCDLRGFSRRSEEASDDLLGLLERVSNALGIMTRQILDHGGVIGDFHGDAAMGFWGWPIPDKEAVAAACRAAIEIRAAFENVAGQDLHAMSGFRVGMGLATGRAVAGKIGTVDQVKVTAFGPVVNFASRLEGMTRQFGMEVLLDETTAQLAAQQMSGDSALVREVAQVRPYGMDSIRRVFELSPLEATRPQLTGDAYHAARIAFENGDWTRTEQLCRGLSKTDHVCRFFIDYIEQRELTAPPGWSGVIELDSK